MLFLTWYGSLNFTNHKYIIFNIIYQLIKECIYEIPGKTENNEKYNLLLKKHKFQKTI